MKESPLRISFRIQVLLLSCEAELHFVSHHKDICKISNLTRKGERSKALLGEIPSSKTLSRENPINGGKGLSYGHL